MTNDVTREEMLARFYEMQESCERFKVTDNYDRKIELAIRTLIERSDDATGVIEATGPDKAAPPLEIIPHANCRTAQLHRCNHCSRNQEMPPASGVGCHFEKQRPDAASSGSRTNRESHIVQPTIKDRESKGGKDVR